MLLDSVVNLDIEHQLELLAPLRWRDEGGGRVSGPSGILKRGIAEWCQGMRSAVDENSGIIRRDPERWPSG
jgi:hypothetical protein